MSRLVSGAALAIVTQMDTEVDYRASAHPTLRRTFVAHKFGWLLASLAAGATLGPAATLALGRSGNWVVPAVVSSLMGALAFVVFSRLRLDVELRAGEVRLRARTLFGRPTETVIARGDFIGFALVDVPRGRFAVRLHSPASARASDAIEMRRERVVRQMND